MHIGLIGGIGPSATVSYYLQLVERFNKLATPLELTIAHADMSVLVANAAESRRDEQAEIFAHHIERLKMGGCEVAMITSLAGHFCFNETKALSPLPLVNGLEVIEAYCAKHDLKRLGLLGSPFVLKTRLYGSLRSCDVVVPDANMSEIGDAYMDMATANRCTEAQRKLFFDAGTEMIEAQGAEAILLAGTDLGLAFQGQDPGFRVIDSLDLHVDALVALASTRPHHLKGA